MVHYLKTRLSASLGVVQELLHQCGPQSGLALVVALQPQNHVRQPGKLRAGRRIKERGEAHARHHPVDDGGDDALPTLTRTVLLQTKVK